MLVGKPEGLLVDPLAEIEARDVAQRIQGGTNVVQHANCFRVEEDAHDADHLKAEALGRAPPLPLIQKNKVGSQLDGKCEALGLASIQIPLEGGD